MKNRILISVLEGEPDLGHQTPYRFILCFLNT